MSSFTDEQFEFAQAASRLALYVQDRAEKLAANLGFGWVATDPAPNVYPALKRAWFHSINTGDALPVSILNSDDVVFACPVDNIRLRFYHDCHHMMTGLTFEVYDELELATMHVMEATAHLDLSSLEFKIFQADTVGQALMQLKARRFAHDQRAFAQDFITYGIDEAICRDLEREHQTTEGGDRGLRCG